MSKPRTVRVLGALFALSVVASVTPASGAGDGVSLESAIADAARFRASLGLSVDPDLLQRGASGASDVSNRRWGVPLTDQEAAEVTRRSLIPERIAPTLAAAGSRADFGGAYLDHTAGGQPILLFAGTGADEFRASRPGTSDSEVTVLTRSVARSLADLERLRTRLHGDSAWFDEAGIELVSSGIDTQNNVLLVGIRGLSDEIRSRLAGRYGPGLAYREDEPSLADACTVNSCWPQKGGIKLFPVNNASRICTSGFTVRYGSPIQYGLLTAGHCVKINGNGNYAHLAAKVVGTPTPHTYLVNAVADAVVIKMNAEPPPTNTLNYFVWEDDITHAVSRVSPNAELVQGSPVCMYGWGMKAQEPATAGRKCGTITVPDVIRPSCEDVNKTICRNIQHQYETNYDTHPGDSGGPVSTGISSAVGLVTDSVKDGTGNRSWFSTVDWAMSAIDNVAGGVRWRVCLNATCTTFW
jgi:hypothetical protein